MRVASLCVPPRLASGAAREQDPGGTRPREHRRSRFTRGFVHGLLALALAVLTGAGRGAGQEARGPASADTGGVDAPETGPSNPFAGFETHFLANGVKVWFKRLPGTPNVSVSAGVPVGSDADPPGREQLAHFTEHMLFSDHDGRTEQEIKDAVEGIGGRRNGVTYRDHTWYYVTIGREHGLFAIEWLAGILSPHEMDPAVVDRGRQPVENEIRARPREFFDHLVAALNPGWLAPPDFWEREFGIERLRAPFPDMWRSLQAITPEDLRGFYDRYYSPAVMTVTIVGDLDREEALDRARSTFGSFPARPVERWTTTAEDPGRGRSAYQWGFQSTASYQSRHKLFHPNAGELLTAMFVRDLLNRRLNQRLRYGERKAVYGASASLAVRGPAAFLQISSRIDEEDYDFARAIIAEEIEFLRSGTLDAAEFEADRAAVIERLRGANQTAESLNAWTRQVFYDPAIFGDFPDVLSFYEELTQSQVASFASRAFDESRQVLSVSRTQPVSQGMAVLAVAALIWITLKAIAWALTKPVRMKDIRYVAHFRLPVVLRTLYALALIAVALALGRVAAAGIAWGVGRWLLPVDSYLVQHAAIGGMLVASLVAAALLLTSPPRKLLIFEDHIRVKSRAWRSRAFRAGDIEDIALERGLGAWFGRGVLRSPPLAFGLLGPGIHLRPVKGRSYFFRSRDTAELAEVLGSWWGRPVSRRPPGKRSRSGRTDDATTGAQAASGASTPGSAPEAVPSRTAPPPPGPGDPQEEIDFDSIGLTDEERRELLGDDR
ncbi:MAG: pitrilysin family protein [Gemmatimonadetes bacterium]|nr:pitrilysin family protein [Gemmatimonadota bacterium]MCY3943887.1 pitrilysin family protein [Gemmatimonadota bacterium]